MMDQDFFGVIISCFSEDSSSVSLLLFGLIYDVLELNSEMKMQCC